MPVKISVLFNGDKVAITLVFIDNYLFMKEHVKLIYTDKIRLYFITRFSDSLLWTKTRCSIYSFIY